MLFFPLSPALMLLENYLTSLTDQTGANFDLLGILVSSGANSSIAEWKRKLVLKKLVGKKKAKNEDSTACSICFLYDFMSIFHYCVEISVHGGEGIHLNTAVLRFHHSISIRLESGGL